MEITGMLKHLGVIRSQLLIFGTLGQLVTHGSGWLLDRQTAQLQQVGGIGLHVLGVVIIMAFGGFYLFAMVKGLPSNPQELKFEESTVESVKDHCESLPPTIPKDKT
jgi:hypothetical protein